MTLIRHALFLFALSVAAGPAWADPSPNAQFKGYVAINEVLTERIVKPGASFTLASYLDEYYYNAGIFGGGGTSLLDLLGTFNGGTLDSSFHNGNPNVINMVLWHVAFSGLGRDLAALCGSGGSSGFGYLDVREDLTASLKPLCSWPAPAAKADDAMMGWWLALMSFDAPETEFEAWRDFFRGPDFAQATAYDTIAAMSLAIFNNPHFLLRK